MNILGVSAGFHDASLAAVSGSDIVFASHSERYSRIKNDPNLHPGLIKDALDALNGRVDVIAFYERPWLRRTREWYSGQRKFLDLENVRVRDILVNQGIPLDIVKHAKIKSYPHHLSHLSLAYQTRYDKSDQTSGTLGVVVDAIGEWDTASLWMCRTVNGAPKYRKLKSMKYPRSIGLMYSAFTEACGLEPNRDEYIMMAISQIFDHGIDILMNVPDVNYHLGLPEEFRDRVRELKLWADTCDLEDMGVTEEQFKLARIAQQHLTDQIQNFIIKSLASDLDVSRLPGVFAGGVALNCVFNRRHNYWVSPNPGDAGSSLGAAALAANRELNWRGPYLGYRIPGKYPMKKIILGLEEHGIVGVANGPAEFSPRALGNRSLLADPSVPGVKDKLNEIKKRQPYRPFAPVSLCDRKDYWFIAEPADYAYMSRTVRVKPWLDRIVEDGYEPISDDMIQAFSHKTIGVVQDSEHSRVQLVHGDPREPIGYHEGLTEVLNWKKFMNQAPVLVNTSLNIKDQPIVNTEQDARDFEREYGVPVYTSDD